MQRRQFLIMLSLAVVVVGAVLYSTVSINQGRLLTLTGSILDVRVASLSPEATLVILDFSAHNPSAIGFEMKQLTVERVDGPSGDVLSKAELLRYLDYAKLGQPNPPLGIGDRIEGGATAQRMVAARFDAPAAGYANATYRIRFRHIENVDAEIAGRKP